MATQHVSQLEAHVVSVVALHPEQHMLKSVSAQARPLHTKSSIPRHGAFPGPCILCVCPERWSRSILQWCQTPRAWDCHEAKDRMPRKRAAPGDILVHRAAPVLADHAHVLLVLIVGKVTHDHDHQLIGQLPEDPAKQQMPQGLALMAGTATLAWMRQLVAPDTEKQNVRSFRLTLGSPWALLGETRSGSGRRVDGPPVSSNAVSRACSPDKDGISEEETSYAGQQRRQCCS